MRPQPCAAGKIDKSEGNVLQRKERTMATNTVPENVVRDFFCCGICGYVFKDPRTLPCHHSFCAECLDKYTDEATSQPSAAWFLCPRCRTVVPVAQRGLTGFPKDTFLAELQRRLGISEHRHRIHELDKDSGLGSVIGSRESLCVPFDDVTTNKGRSDVVPERVCSVCESKPEHYCEVCNRFICEECSTYRGEHALHRVQSIAHISVGCRQELQKSLHTTRKEMSSLRRGLSELDKYRMQMKTSKEDAIQDITNRIDAIQRELNLAHQRLVSEVEVLTLTEVNRVDMQRDHLKFNVATLENLSLIMLSILNNGSDLQIMKTSSVFVHAADEAMKNISRSEEHHLQERPFQVKLIEPVFHLNKEVGELCGRIWQGRGNVPKELDGQSRVGTFSEEARMVDSFSLLSESSRQTPCLTNIASTENGELLVVDQANKVVKFVKKGATYKKIYGSENLFGISKLSGDKIVVTDHTVHIFEASGRFEKVLRPEPRDCRGVAVSGDKVYTADACTRCVYVISLSTGTVQKVITQAAGIPFKTPSWIAIGKNAEVALSDPGSGLVSIFDFNYSLLGQCCAVSNPSGLLFDPSGEHLLICDAKRNSVVACDLTGKLVRTVVGEEGFLHQPQALTTDEGGRLYVAEKDGQVKVFTWKA
ncbi:hypothetical protein CAPTEDRAFT_217655 [Capitella teleta]|uniref:RING-type domain-containing protein n=1 Tax=Capitella teleta TaxID=283909 RepID=X2AMH9_CAPTE|nr:hypothetical protein CAPTEDRAFT_217655 [Capitella teleta]|eukprot:ELU00272.1 hypothetical protein CAPTEDRAFT_217655 [Capitella teleta]